MAKRALSSAQSTKDKERIETEEEQITFRRRNKAETKRREKIERETDAKVKRHSGDRDRYERAY
jgi:hypothetical protein